MASISVGGTPVTEAQLLALGTTPVTITTASGTLILTGYNPATGLVSYTYDPVVKANNTGGSDSFAVTITDDNGITSSVNSLDITILDSKPTAMADGASVTEDTALVATGTVLTNDTVGADTNATPVTAANVTLTHGSLVLNSNGTYTYTLDNTNPAVNALNTNSTPLTDTYTYTLTDGDGSTTTAVLTITITGTNDAPVAVADVNTVSEDAVNVAGDVTPGTTGQDSDVDGDTLNIIGVASGTQTSTSGNVATAVAGTYGSVNIAANGSYTYTPSAAAQALKLGQNGTDIFSYTISDGNGGTATTTLTITVQGANDAPTITGPLTGTVTEDGTTTATGSLTIVDPDAGESNFVAQTGIAGTYGTFSVTAAGVWTYTLTNSAANVQALAQGQTPTEIFSITSADGSIRSVVVTVNGSNDAPIAVADTNAITEETTTAPTTVSGDVTPGTAGQDRDIDNGATFTVTGVAAGTQTSASGNVGTTVAGTYGSVNLAADGSYTYTLDNTKTATNSLKAGQTASEVFTYTITDNNGAVSTTTLSITITGTNDAPVAVNDSYNMNEDGAAITLAPLTADTDLDGDTLSVQSINGTTLTPGTAQVIIVPHGTVNVSVAGVITFTPTANYNGDATFAYIISDGHGGTATANETITIAAVNDAPSGTDKTITMFEDGRYTVVVADFGFTDPNDSPANNFQSVIVNVPTSGALFYNGVAITSATTITLADLNAGKLIYSPAANVNGTGVANFTFQVADDGGTTNGGQNTDQSANTLTFNVTPTVDVSAKWIDYWTFNEGTGTSTTNTNTFIDRIGTITNNTPHTGQVADPSADLRPTWTLPTDGRNGSTAMQFKGVGGASSARDGGWIALDSSVTNPLAGLTASKAATLSFWINTTQVGSTIGWDSPSVIGMENNGAVADIQWGWIDANGKIGFGMGDNTGLMSTNVVSDGTWHQVTISHDFTSGKTYLWVDGVNNVNGTVLLANTVVATNKFLGLGVTADDGATSNRFLNAKLEDVRIYDSVLTTTQVQAIYETELMGYQNSVIANDGHALHFSLSVNNTTSLIISGLPNGTIVTDGGTHSFTVGAAGTADITGWNASELEVNTYGTGSFMMMVTGSDAAGTSVNQYLSVVTAADMFTGTTSNDSLTGNTNDNVLTGGDGNDTLSGGAGNDALFGGAGNDTLDGGSGANVLYGEAGNDTLAYNGADKFIDGGAGTDTLLLATGSNIDFSILNSTNDPIKNIEIIDLNTTSAHTLVKISFSDVIDMTDSNHQLTILGNSGDSVSLQNTTGATWTKDTTAVTEVINGSSHVLDVYHNSADSTVLVKVEQSISDQVL